MFSRYSSIAPPLLRSLRDDDNTAASHSVYREHVSDRLSCTAIAAAAIGRGTVALVPELSTGASKRS